jgi:anhydro-N-acetylmuramic acid kinase
MPDQMSNKVLNKVNANPSQFNAIGLMSGTSLDGIDVALLRTDGQSFLECGPFMSVNTSDAMRKKLTQALETAKSIVHRHDRPGDLAQIERELTLLHADAVASLLAEHKLRISDVDLVGFHGQTVLHRPEDGVTVQLGDGPLLSQMLGVPVVYDMRANDMVHGGQGAPLAPVYHQALAANLGAEYSDVSPVCFVNIGGISNLTVVANEQGHNSDPIAFDCGPGNVLIDQWVFAHNGAHFDKGGEIALRGKVIHQIADQYIGPMITKINTGQSLDRLDFTPLKKGICSFEDGARTLAYITAKMIAYSNDRLEIAPKLWIISGGGRLNQAIMDELSSELPNHCNILKAEDLDISGDAVEAQAWAYLAVRAQKSYPLTFPLTTGVSHAVTGGVIARAK